MENQITHQTRSNALSRAPALAVMAVLFACPFTATAELANDTLGRLFLSPAERAKIENSRGQEAASEMTFDEAGPQIAAKPTDATVALNGLVRRADGNDIIWVNGQIIGDRLGTSTDVKVRRGPDAANNVVLESIGTARPVKLKPGQSWDNATNKAVDCFRCMDPVDDLTADQSDADE